MGTSTGIALPRTSIGNLRGWIPTVESHKYFGGKDLANNRNKVCAAGRGTLKLDLT